MLGLIYRALSAISSALVAAIFLLIIADVLARFFFSSSIFFAVSAVEYAQLYFTALVAPVLARTDEHVSVDLLGRITPERWFNPIKRVSQVISAVVCTAFGLAALWLLVESVQARSSDIRGITLPSWVVYAPLVVCFLLLGLEYAIQAVRGRRAAV